MTILNVSVIILGMFFLFLQLTNTQSQVDELTNQNHEFQKLINQLEAQISESEYPFNIFKEILFLNENRTDPYSIVIRDWWLLKKNSPGAIYIEKNSWSSFMETLQSNPPPNIELNIDVNNKIV